MNAPRNQAQIVIIGGGIAGCSTLFHLSELGCTDVILVERDELTSGSTWHAAAQVTQFGANQTMIAMKRHSIDLYQRLAADPDFPINYHITGGMRLAHTAAELDIYRHHVAVARGVGVDMEVIDAVEVGKRHALINPDGLLGAWWDPLDGDIDPSQLTQALARKARQAGAEIQRFNPVESITRASGQHGEWTVHTKNGDIRCEIVVNATGYRVNEVGRMLGVEHPVTSMEHMYFLTDPIPTLEAMTERVPIIRDPGDDFYSRQEKHGLLVGIYEQACKPFGLDGIDPNFTMALCPNDLDRCLDNMEGIFQRVPALADIGIHSIINGPITYTIDGAPLVGPIPGLSNAFACLGLRAGIGEGGGLGKILAELIVHGESEWDPAYLDPRRFTAHAGTELTVLKAIEDYQNEFHYHRPREQRPAGRLAKTTSLYPVHDALGARFGVINGWERPQVYLPGDQVERERFEQTMPGYRYSEVDDVIGQEITKLTQSCSLMEVNGFGRFAIQGPGAEAFLKRMTVSRLPIKNGRVALCYLLNPHGNVLSEATLARFDAEHYWYGCAAGAEWHDRDWLMQHAPDDVQINNLTASHSMLVLAGPQARERLQQLCPRDDCSPVALPWLGMKPVQLGHVRAHVMAISYSGELAFEIHVPVEQLYLAWQTIHQLGPIGHFGLFAAESMRLEKGFRAWKHDLITEFDPFESGLARFVDRERIHSKHPPIGLDAALEREHTPRKRFVSLIIESGAFKPGMPTAQAGDPIALPNGKQIGSITSGGIGHRVQQHIAMGFVEPAHSAIDRVVQVELLGKLYPARIVDAALYDPHFDRIRGTVRT